MRTHNKQEKILKKGQLRIAYLSYVAMISLCFLLYSISLFSQEETQKEEKSSVTWEPHWKNGYKMESSDKSFHLKFGGRLYTDWAASLYQDDSLTALHGKPINGTEFRNVRFFNSGTIYNNVEYKIEVDFAGGDISFKDVYIEIVDLPVIGNLRIGHFKEPFNLEEHTSSKFISFMERSLASAFAPGRNSGFMASNHVMNDKLTWAMGAFRESDSFGNAKKYYTARTNVTARITALPLYDKENFKLLHLGLAYSMRNPDEQMFEIAEKPESHIQKDDYVATGIINDVNSVTLLGAELSFAKGPFSLQGEYISSTVQRTTQDTSMNDIDITNKFSGFYAMASFFLTKGDHRGYNTSEGVFDRVVPVKNFGDNGGLGAIELVARYSGLDLIDGTKKEYNFIADEMGGKLSNITIGLNWYLNPATRLMMNYIITSVQGVDEMDETKLMAIGKAGFYQMRLQVDF